MQAKQIDANTLAALLDFVANIFYVSNMRPYTNVRNVIRHQRRSDIIIVFISADLHLIHAV